MSDATVAVHLNDDATGLRLKVATDSGFTLPIYSSAVSTSNCRAKITITGLSADTLYYYRVQKGGEDISTLTGQFRTKPAASFAFAFASCANTGSNATVFDTIRSAAPKFFIHMGDRHYTDIAVAEDTPFFESAERCIAQGKQAQLFREVSTYYTWDDHDFGPNDSDGTSLGRDNACRIYRETVPHPQLVLTGPTDPIYYTFDVGRVRFIVTDLRSEASPKGDTDNSSKTMLGATQKTWFKNLIQSSTGYYIIWVSSRVFHANAIAGHDSWGGFTTERTELANHINTYASGRVLVITGDRHQAGIDNGTNCNYASGGDPITCVMAAPLDQTVNTHGSATFSSGVFSNNGQYGWIAITDGGGATITVDCAVKNSAGTNLATLSLSPSL